MYPPCENGLRVEVSEDKRHVVMTLDSDHAEELAKFISLIGMDRGAHDPWLALTREAAHDTWLRAMLRLIACAQNVQRPPILRPRSPRAVRPQSAARAATPSGSP